VTPTSTASASITSSPQNNRRDDWSTHTYSAAITASTSNGIIYDSSAAPSVTASATSSSASANPTSAFAITEEVLDFARVAVLYVLQQEQLDSAASAQTALQKFFSADSFTNRAAMNVSLGNSNSVNLVTFAVDVGNGTIGAKNSSLSKRNLDGQIANLWIS
jgi:hypothetical protein